MVSVQLAVIAPGVDPAGVTVVPAAGVVIARLIATSGPILAGASLSEANSGR
jgi:hypothetical protein